MNSKNNGPKSKADGGWNNNWPTGGGNDEPEIEEDGIIDSKENTMRVGWPK